ncbi:MAG: hypothetical protein ACP5N7_01110 [Candidatus Pacearchaeota archaeon]
MGGIVKVLSYAEGTQSTGAPDDIIISSNNTLTFANDADYVTFKGSAASLGDFYGNTTTGKLRFHNGITWSDLNNALNNFTAVAAPTINDDSGDGYSVGSIWLNTSTNEFYIAASVSVGAAVWISFLDKATTQTITGQKTFSAITNFTNATQSTDKDTGAVIIEGGLGVEKNTYIGGNLVVTGDAQVNGTTTFINSTNLEITDPNIILNKGGTQLTADDASGITIEMSDATHAKIIYDKDATSKFKCGNSTTEKEIVTISDSQILTNKTLDDSTTTFANTATPTKKIKFDCTSIGAATIRTITAPDSDGTLVYKDLIQDLTNKNFADANTTFYDTDSTTRKARIDCASITAGNTRVITVPDSDLTLVGEATAQTITNKILNGGTASASKYWLLPGDTLANLNALGRVKKAIYYDETNNVIVYDDGVTLNQVGSGSGGAGGGVQIIWRNDSELAAYESTRFNQLAYEFNAGETNKVYGSIRVPTGYTAGKQISLKIKVASPTASGNVLLKAYAYLINSSSANYGDTSLNRTTTNTAQAISVADFGYAQTLDISTAGGQIAATAIAPGDEILFYIFRDTDTNADVAYFYPSSVEVYIAP